jgi:hypothetical protein
LLYLLNIYLPVLTLAGGTVILVKIKRTGDDAIAV